MVRATAYVLRFIHNARNKVINRLTGSIKVNELTNAINSLARLSQRESFPNEYNLLMNGKQVKPKDRLSKFNLFFDNKYNIMRVGGRINNSTEFNYNKKHPILLSDPHDFSPLTPGHFLIGRPLTAPVCDDDLRDVPINRLSHYQRVEQLRQHFWSRWSKEYISELQMRSKWRETVTDLKPNAMVLIKDINLPPLKWQLGRVIRTIPGSDGVSRVADIRTSTGITRRAYAKICPLNTDDDTELKKTVVS
ncbi:uncharacterized protein LOC126979985 [Leptidea sinapis]|uniref:uncharacterized protein LOC126979985 n=1 Tax=Leptidea sinapis TaxID=189913 RepID=UPI0021C4302E|nr:uncharacterized protein LOC126979985 [Leptidea sinapis]